MADFRPADHAMGLELQLEELIEQRTRARVQGRADDVAHLDGEIRDLQLELAATAEQAAAAAPPSDDGPVLHHPEQLGIEDQPT